LNKQQEKGSSPCNSNSDPNTPPLYFSEKEKNGREKEKNLRKNLQKIMEGSSGGFKGPNSDSVPIPSSPLFLPEKW